MRTNWYFQGHKPLPDDMAGSSSRATPYSSYNQSPFESPILSYQVSPSSSAFPSPSRSGDTHNISTIFPFLRNGGINPSSLPPLRISNSAPVTPPVSSPPSRNPKPLPTWESLTKQTMANAARQSVSSFNYPFYAVSAPTSPTHHRQFNAPATLPECNESDSSTIDSGHWISFQKFSQQPFHGGSSVSPSPTFNLVKPPLPQQLSPNTSAAQEIGQNSQVKPWEGERIHDVAMEDLELTLGNSKGRSWDEDQKNPLCHVEREDWSIIECVSKSFIFVDKMCCKMYFLLSFLLDLVKHYKYFITNITNILLQILQIFYY